VSPGSAAAPGDLAAQARLDADAANVDEAERASRRYLSVRIGRFLEGKEAADDTLAAPKPPPGEPIGESDPLGCAGA